MSLSEVQQRISSLQTRFPGLAPLPPAPQAFSAALRTASLTGGGAAATAATGSTGSADHG